MPALEFLAFPLVISSTLRQLWHYSSLWLVAVRDRTKRYMNIMTMVSFPLHYYYTTFPKIYQELFKKIFCKMNRRQNHMTQSRSSTVFDHADGVEMEMNLDNKLISKKSVVKFVPIGWAKLDVAAHLVPCTILGVKLDIWWKRKRTVFVTVL